MTYECSNEVGFWHWMFESLLSTFQSSYKLDVLKNMCEKNIKITQ